MGTFVSVIVLAGIWLSDRPKVNSSTLYIANHTTLEQLAFSRDLVYSQPLIGMVVYMGCSDVSEFEHIYGQILTTPSCVYSRLFT